MNQPEPIRFQPTRFFESFIAVARELLVRPRRFFEQLGPSGSLVGPLTFLLVCLFLSSLFLSNVTGGGLRLLLAFLISGVAAAVLGSLCLHSLLASRLFNTRLPYEATLSVIAYAAIVDLVAWIPLLDIVANIYGIYLMYLGFRGIHQLSPRRAGVAVLLAMLLIGSIRLFMIRLIAPDWLQSLMKAVDTAGGIPA